MSWLFVVCYSVLPVTPLIKDRPTNIIYCRGGIMKGGIISNRCRRIREDAKTKQVDKLPEYVNIVIPSVCPSRLAAADPPQGAKGC